MSQTLAKNAKRTEVTKALYMGPTSFEGRPAHIMFVSHTRKGENHVYDQAMIARGSINNPDTEYQEHQLLREHVDFTVVYSNKGFPVEINMI